MKNLLFLTLTLCSFILPTQAQMWSPALQDTLYGNEWIDFDNADRYYKIKIAEDGIYRIPQSMLPESANNVAGQAFHLYHLGNKIPLYVTNNGTLEANDYIEFYGKKNRAEMDKWLFADSNDLLNEKHSMFTDTSAYWLTWSDDTPLRYEDVANDMSNLPAKETHFMAEATTLQALSHNKRYQKVGTASFKHSYFGAGEGFAKIISSNTQTITVNTPNVYTSSSDNATLTLPYVSYTSGEHDVHLSVNGTEYYSNSFSQYQFNTAIVDLPLNELATNAATVVVQGMEGTTDRQAIPYCSILYPHTFDFGGTDIFSFTIEASPNERYLEIENFASGSEPILYDLTNQIRITSTILDNGMIGIRLPPSNEDRDLILVSSMEGVSTVAELAQVTFIDFEDINAEYLLISHENLMSHPDGNNYVQEYSDYRSNEYTTAIAEINQLYDQFGYGIETHPQSIRNFGHYINKYWEDIHYVFLVGKAREYNLIRTQNPIEADNLVPTFGHPGSDNLLFSTNITATPMFSIGRLAARTADDVRLYLDKVIAQESNEGEQTIADQAWKKRVIHLGGGGTIGEQNSIRNNLSSMEQILENGIIGADVYSYYKSSTDAIENSRSEEIKELLDTGVSIVTFYGHSSANAFEFNIENPQELNNTDRYFLLISNGCFSGQCHNAGTGIGERFIIEEGKGAIAYYASTGYGAVSSLYSFTSKFYLELGATNYGGSIGDNFRNSIAHLDPQSIIYSGSNILAQQNTLQGDPAIVLNARPGPDVVIDNSSVQFDPPLLNTQLDSFDITFNLTNIGRNTGDSLFVEVKQQYPTGDEIAMPLAKVKIPGYQKELSLRLPMDKEKSVGLNTFYISADLTDTITELPAPAAELNNNLTNSLGVEGISIYIVSNDIVPVYPREFSIINSPTFNLKASTVNALSETDNFIFEIDTTMNFNSPIRKRSVQNDSGGVLTWQPNIPAIDNAVYYWRVSPDTISTGGDYRWQASSFVYMPNESEGWNQSHFFQYQQDDYSQMKIEDNRQFEYINDFKDIKIVNSAYQPGIITYRCVMSNNVPLTCSSYLYNGVQIVILDTITVKPLINNYPDITGNGSIIHAFPTTTLEQREKLIHFITDSIPSRHYVAFMTMQQMVIDYEPEEWAADSTELGTNLFKILENQGALIVNELGDTLQEARPYGFFFRKDIPGYIGGEFIGELGELKEGNWAVEANWDEGKVISTPIGPAASWESMTWDYTELNEPTDYAAINIYGIRQNGDKELITSDLQTPEYSLQTIDAEEYPFLQLEFDTKDSILRSPPQLDFWRVKYEGVPEAAIAANYAFEINKDTVQQGEPFELKIGMRNISDHDMDSLLVSFKVVNQENNILDLPQRLQPLLEGDSLVATLNVDTRNLKGLQSILIDMNPAEDQPEQTHINNVALLNFYVQQDKRNPVLDVTFDGQHIMDGDIISPEPIIFITLQDENQYLELADTALFDLEILLPNALENQNISFSDPRVRFTPADTDNLENKNKATIEFTPKFEIDGEYKLFVRSKDATGNNSSELNYEINFEVINKSMISNVLNYPNPFSTSTRFVYTLTGVEPPTFFKLQIMTISGSIVRELTQDDLGMLRTGTHQTDFAWDGTDQFGDRLANGVYLYRLTAQKANGEDFERYETGADRFFNQGFGKLVIVR